MRDPAAAQQACAELLRAFGVTPVDQTVPSVETRRAAHAVAVAVAR